MTTQKQRRTIDEPINLTKIVTRAGDGGRTSLADGARVSKDDLRVEAYGSVDELNAAIGLAFAALAADSNLRPWLTRIQNELFDLGADLAAPPADNGRTRLRIETGQVAALDALCSQLTSGQEPLRTFLLPGGCEPSARLHLAGTVCRRAERRAVALSRNERVNPHALAYLNRLGDLLFILARAADSECGAPPRLWRPGASTGARAAERILAEPTPPAAA
ncbi:MAG: cob(I)yrinic acid a,c-diamide adenosyltransferase [Acidobacteriota bacterium]|nr:cob(I)yrinic acid a,c-diamide adenosyltransferase [Acidobacteriota bacterium]